MNIVKYLGGKEKEIPAIMGSMPAEIGSYYDPFVGGGCVYLEVTAEKYFINDLSSDLMLLYGCIARQDGEFFSSMERINTAWKRIGEYAGSGSELFDCYTAYRDNMVSKEKMETRVKTWLEGNRESILKSLSSMNTDRKELVLRELEKSIPRKYVRLKDLHYNRDEIYDDRILVNIEGCFKAAFYTYIRYLYNHMEGCPDGVRAMLFLFLRDMCYGSLYRFNKKNHFNIPYGGVSYNQKNYDKRIGEYQDEGLIARMARTTFGNMDYLDFLRQHVPQPSDFVFLDPPYDTTFSTYDGNPFVAKDQEALADYLITECRARFLLDIRCTELTKRLYPEGTVCRSGEPLRILRFDKQYNVNFKNRNRQDAQHMLVMNYTNTK